MTDGELTLSLYHVGHVDWLGSRQRTAKNNFLPHSTSENAFTNSKLTTWQRVEPTWNDGGRSDVLKGTTKNTDTVHIVLQQ
jgi:hypothetical protein